MKRSILVLLALSIVVFNSCTKTGSPGPQGPQGPTGNANVIGADPFTVYSSTWSYTTVPGSSTPAYVTSFNLADVTNAVANHGLVEIYIKYSDNTWKNLPDILNGTMFTYNFSAGGFDLYYTMVDGTAPGVPPTEVFRTVIIPSSYRQAYPTANWKNYNETMAILNGPVPTAVQ